MAATLAAQDMTWHDPSPHSAQLIAVDATLERPALTRLREFVKKRGVAVIVVHRLDRLVRSLLKSAVLLEEIRLHGVRLVIVTAPEPGNAAVDNFMLNILASFAKFEREMIAAFPKNC